MMMMMMMKEAVDDDHFTNIRGLCTNWDFLFLQSVLIFSASEKASSTAQLNTRRNFCHTIEYSFFRRDRPNESSWGSFIYQEDWYSYSASTYHHLLMTQYNAITCSGNMNAHHEEWLGSI
jgi:hypothetical protein